jgi:soluble lytic murein transglycosylase-like protein
MPIRVPAFGPRGWSHAIGLGSFALLLLLQGCDRPEVRRVPPEKVWSYLEKQAPRHHLDPGFVYAIVFAESSFNANASNGVGRGIAQMSEAAWQTVGDLSYRRAWNWRTNLSMALRYLAYCREGLNRAGHFNYPLLAACYRYGPNAVRRADYQLTRLPPPRNKTYQAIFGGHIHPIRPPPS